MIKKDFLSEFRVGIFLKKDMWKLLSILVFVK